MMADYQAQIQQAYRDFLNGRSVSARAGQKQMIADIVRHMAAIKEDAEGQRVGYPSVQVIEAGTGTGKTLAYLLACIPICQAREKRLVISTATVALQEQLMLRDLPDLKRLTQLEFTHALAKGRGRYLCTAQLVRLARPQEKSEPMDSLFDTVPLNQPDADVQQLYVGLAEAFSTGRWDGDRDSLPTPLPQDVWRSLTVDHQRCSNRRCPHFLSACPFFNARRALEQADVIIANHDLVLSDLALGGGMILPAPEQTYYVFDEAHHLPDKAIQHFEAGFRFNATLRWMRQLKRSLPDVPRLLVNQPALLQLVSQLEAPVDRLEALLGQIYADLSTATLFQESHQQQSLYRWPQGRLPETLMTQAAAQLPDWLLLNRALEKLLDGLKNLQEQHPAEDEQRPLAELLGFVHLLYQRSLNALTLWKLCAQADTPDHPPKARWLVQHRLQEGDEDLELCVSPVSAADDLAGRLWSRCFGATLTSATLTALGHFDHFYQRAGLTRQMPCAVYPSPFDYARLGVLEVPAGACDPVRSEQHTQAIIEFVSTELNHPSAAVLVLFSSRRQMQDVQAALPQTLQRSILVQDELSKNRLLEKHRARVDAGKPSILFGLASLAEGIDLPGKYLTHVVLVRLPFSIPDDPVTATLTEWVEAQGGNAFMQISVPEASIRLVQACGRLIRTETDEGRITLLDRRILTKAYGRQLLACLPAFRHKIAT